MVLLMIVVGVVLAAVVLFGVTENATGTAAAAAMNARMPLGQAFGDFLSKIF